MSSALASAAATCSAVGSSSVLSLPGSGLGALGLVAIRISLRRTRSGWANLGLVLVIKLLNFFARDLNVAADLGADHLLGENAILGVLLELLPADAL